MTMRIPERMPPVPDVPGSSPSSEQLVVPGREASQKELHDFVVALPLPDHLKSELTKHDLPHVVTHFRIHSIDPGDEGACSRFAKDYALYLRHEVDDSFANAPDVHGMTPLMRAVRERDFELVSELIDHSARPDGLTVILAVTERAPDQLVKTLFQFALFRKLDLPREDIYRLLESMCLLAQRNHPFAIDCLKWAMAKNRLNLYQACWCAHAAVIPLLKSAGDDLNRQYYGMTPLTAVLNESASSEVVEALLKAGADAKLRDGRGQTPLEAAFQQDLKWAALMLVQNGATPTVQIKSWIDAPDEAT